MASVPPYASVRTARLDGANTIDKKAKKMPRAYLHTSQGQRLLLSLAQTIPRTIRWRLTRGWSVRIIHHVSASMVDFDGNSFFLPFRPSRPSRTTPLPQAFAHQQVMLLSSSSSLLAWVTPPVHFTLLRTRMFLKPASSLFKPSKAYNQSLTPNLLLKPPTSLSIFIPAIKMALSWTQTIKPALKCCRDSSSSPQVDALKLANVCSGAI
ncbi:hypothetical protein K438DRAFT_517318 [Mycena galopus ATCC 62051]|nr:hypothetical protein K438DRAFT_517318 [Mycena galopus ATCC 62051]